MCACLCICWPGVSVRYLLCLCVQAPAGQVCLCGLACANPGGYVCLPGVCVCVCVRALAYAGQVCQCGLVCANQVYLYVLACVSQVCVRIS